MYLDEDFCIHGIRGRLNQVIRSSWRIGSVVFALSVQVAELSQAECGQ